MSEPLIKPIDALGSINTISLLLQQLSLPRSRRRPPACEQHNARDQIPQAGPERTDSAEVTFAGKMENRYDGKNLE
jgi:hypothetical protein